MITIHVAYLLKAKTTRALEALKRKTKILKKLEKEVLSKQTTRLSKLLINLTSKNGLLAFQANPSPIFDLVLISKVQIAWEIDW